MKKVLCFLLLSTCLLSVAVYADDGSLKIDTDIHSKQESKEVHYIEQESELAKLFRADTSESIQTVQENTKNTEKKEKDNLFLGNLSSTNIMEAYQPLLFTSKTMISNTGDYHISLNEKSPALSWQVLGVLSLAFCVLGYSIIRAFTRKKEGNRL
ncbi:type VII secretion protein EssA [Streptococcus respiraculi]|uniref:type VII secretion protein EssA n=1 Tax=Streptococcus respiraculi TaxID=2021971 RepID=UPI000E7074A5|nr:type VII secretion protein EssA [Streptococcus respiraculi]